MVITNNVLPVIERCLTYDGMLALATIAERFVRNDSQNETELKQQIANWKNGIAAQKLCLEILTNLCCMDHGDSMCDETEQVPSDNATSPELVSCLRTDALLDKVVAMCAAHSTNLVRMTEMCSGIKPEAEQLCEVQPRALACLNNMLLFLDPPIRGNEKAVALWNFLCNLCADATNRQNSETAELITRSMWTLLRDFNSPGTDCCIAPSVEVTEGILAIAIAAQGDTQTNAVGLLAHLGALPHLRSLDKKIGETLLQILASYASSSVSAIAEALNAIFDIYGDTESDDSFRQLQMLQRITALAPLLQQKVRQESTLQEEASVVERAEEALENLVRFIEYKSSSQ